MSRSIISRGGYAQSSIFQASLNLTAQSYLKQVFPDVNPQKALFIKFQLKQRQLAQQLLQLIKRPKHSPSSLSNAILTLKQEGQGVQIDARLTPGHFWLIIKIEQLSSGLKEQLLANINSLREAQQRLRLQFFVESRQRLRSSGKEQMIGQLLNSFRLIIQGGQRLTFKILKNIFNLNIIENLIESVSLEIRLKDLGETFPSQVKEAYLALTAFIDNIFKEPFNKFREAIPQIEIIFHPQKFQFKARIDTVILW